MTVTANPLMWDYPQEPAQADNETLRAYFQRIKDCTEDERIKHADFIAARNRLIEIHYPGIKAIAGKYFRTTHFPGFTLGDYISNGVLGAIDAAIRYDGSYKFMTFASQRILGQIKDALREETYDSTKSRNAPEERRTTLFRSRRRDTNGKLVSLAQPRYDSEKPVALGDTLSDPLSDQQAARLAEGEEWAEVRDFLIQALPQAQPNHVQAFLLYLSGKTMKLVAEEIELSESRVSQMISQLPQMIKPALERIVWSKPHSFAVIDETKYSAKQGLYLFRGHVPIGPYRVTVYGVSPDRLGTSVDIGMHGKAECLPISAANFAKGVFTDQSFVPFPLRHSFHQSNFVSTPYVKSEDTMTIASATDNVAFSTESLLKALDTSKHFFAQIVAAMIEEPTTTIAAIMQNRKMMLTEPLKVNILRCVMPDADSKMAARIDDADFRAELKSTAIEFYTRGLENTPPATTPPPPATPLHRPQPHAAPTPHTPPAVTFAAGNAAQNPPPLGINEWIQGHLDKRSKTQLAILTNLVNPDIPDENFTGRFDNNFSGQLKKGLDLLEIDTDKDQFGKRKFNRAHLRDLIVAKYQSASAGSALAPTIPAAPVVQPTPTPEPVPLPASFTGSFIPATAVNAIVKRGEVTTDPELEAITKQLNLVLGMVLNLQKTVGTLRQQNAAFVRQVGALFTPDGNLDLNQLAALKTTLRTQ